MFYKWGTNLSDCRGHRVAKQHASTEKLLNRVTRGLRNIVTFLVWIYDIKYYCAYTDIFNKATQRAMIMNTVW